MYAPAWAGLAWAWIARQPMGFSSPDEATPIAVQAARGSTFEPWP